MSSRDAVDTLRGYFYQFDYTIDQILNSTSDDTIIHVESIEDVDIDSIDEYEAIQCKYYAKTEYTHSVIAKPIRLMLNHFQSLKSTSSPLIKYKLRGHYNSGQEKLVLPLDLQSFKDDFLTYKKDNVQHFHHVTLSLSDEDLKEFITLLDIDINAESLEQQFKNLMQRFRRQFDCSEFASEYYFYNNALRIVKDLAIQSDSSNRSITKADFLSRIDNSNILFNEWFVKRRGHSAHLAKLRSEYFTSLSVSPFERFFLIEVPSHDYSRSDLKELIFIIVRKWSKLKQIEPTPFCPYIYLHGISSEELIEIKRELNREDHKIIDGFDFLGADFNSASMVIQANHLNRIKLKVITNTDQLSEILSVVTKTRKIFQFYVSAPFFSSDNAAIKHVRIQIDKLTNIKQII